MSKIEDFEIVDGVIVKYRGQEKNPVIPQDVIGIGNSAFENSTISGIVLPDGLNFIKRQAFYNCKELIKIEMPRYVNRIDDFSFAGCSALKEVHFLVVEDEPSYKSTWLNNCAFADCTSLEEIELPEHVIMNGYRIFKGCSALKSVKIMRNITQIPSEAFMNCVALDGVTLPANVKKICSMAFCGCSSLKNITAKDTKLIELGKDAFKGTQIDPSNFKLPKSKKPKNENVTEFEFAKRPTGGYKATLVNVSFEDKELVFPAEYDGAKVTDLSVSKACKEKMDANGMIFDKVVIPKNAKNYVTASRVLNCRTLVLEEGVNSLCEFWSPSLVEVFLPKSLKTIEKNALKDIKTLKKIHIPKESKLSFIDANALPLKEDGSVIDALLPSCTVENGNIYIPSEDNPYFMLVSLGGKGRVNARTEIAAPSTQMDKKDSLYVYLQEYNVVTLREILNVSDAQKKPILELPDGWRIEGDELIDENENIVYSLDGKAVVHYFYFHGGHFWKQSDISMVPSPISFGYKGWKCLATVKKHYYQDLADIYPVVEDDGKLCYDYERELGTLNILSCPEAFNMIGIIDSECG